MEYAPDEKSPGHASDTIPYYYYIFANNKLIIRSLFGIWSLICKISFIFYE